MQKQSTLTEKAEQLLETRDKTVSEHILKSPKHSNAKEKNRASTQRKAAEHDFDNK